MSIHIKIIIIIIIKIVEETLPFEMIQRKVFNKEKEQACGRIIVRFFFSI
jgi:hypothetical protein